MSILERDVTLKVGKTEAKLSEKLYLYRGDKDIQLNIFISDINLKFRDKNGNLVGLEKEGFAMVVMKKPSGDIVRRKRVPISGGAVQLLIDEPMCDELNEVGEIITQIKIYSTDDDTSPRFTLPSFEGIEILEPVGGLESDEARVGVAKADLNIVTYGVVLPPFQGDGQYNKTTWVTGDLITSGNLNKIETALEELTSNSKELHDYIMSNPTTTAYDIVVEGDNVGGFKVGDVIPSGLNLTNVVERLTKTEVPPIYTQPNLSMSSSKTGMIKANEMIDINIRPIFTQNDAGRCKNYTLNKNDNTIFIEGNPLEYIDRNVTLKHGETIVYKGIVTYGDGAIKNTNLGIPYPNGQIKEGSLTSNTAILSAFAPSYFGVTNTKKITIAVLNTLTESLKNTKILSYNHISCNDQYLIYAYPQSFGALTSIKDTNGFDYINSYDRFVDSFNGTNYYIYILRDSMTANDYSQIFS